jgi:hypothetical protein
VRWHALTAIVFNIPPSVSAKQLKQLQSEAILPTAIRQRSGASGRFFRVENVNEDQKIQQKQLL